MTTLHEYYGLKRRFGQVVDMSKMNLFGVEVEVETEEPINIRVPSKWTQVGDGSLREFGYEFISSPLRLEDTKKAVDKLFKELNALPTLRQDTPRTSIHVHANVYQRTHLEVLTALTHYWLIENILLDMCGPGREGNLFCRRLCDAPHTIQFLRTYMNHGREIFNAHRDRYKYAACNIATIMRQGTLEFRAMGGLYETDRIHAWLEQIDYMINGGKFSNPYSVIDAYYENRLDNKKLGELFFTPSCLKFIEVDGLRMRRNLGLLFDLATSTPDWNKWQENISEVSLKKTRQTKSDGLNFDVLVNIIDDIPNMPMEDE